MLIIVDHRIPQEAKKSLQSLCPSLQATLIELETTGLVYPEISGHPDIFICKTPQTLVVSPNLPERYFAVFAEQRIRFVKGHFTAGELTGVKTETHLPPNLRSRKKLESKANTGYNAAVSEDLLVHRLEYTDPIILENCHYLKKIPVKQGYTRCNLLLLKEGHYITSDNGIDTALKNAGFQGIFTDPEKTVLPGFPNGFTGGAMGIHENCIYLIGSLSYIPEGSTIAEFAAALGYRITELYDGPLFDGGGILFA
jgi:hypothetical protein